MSDLTLTLTDAGRAALINAQNNGTTPVLLSEIGVSSTYFVANADTSVLPDEIKRLSTFSGQTVAADTLHVTLRDESEDHYPLRSFALYLDNGTLLGVCSQPEPILEKSAQAIVLLAVDIRLLQDSAAVIQFGTTDFMNPPATTHQPGVIALATADEALNGVDNERAITSVTLKTVLDQHQQPWHRVTAIPASVHIPGQMILFAGPNPPPGTLACDGSQVLRRHYPALFAAIGTTHGAGDGYSTFHLPNIPEGFSLINTHQAEKVGTKTSGENKQHSHKATVSANGKHVHSASSSTAGHHGHAAHSSAAGHHAHSANSSVAGKHAHHADVHAAGSHAHSASSGSAGSHTHSAWTDAQGNHQHTAPFGERHWNFPWGQTPTAHHLGSRRSDWDNVMPYTSWAGKHAHNVGIGANGAHTHPISIAANGQHVHGITVAANGDHQHAISVTAAGEHKHAITVAENGNHTHALSVAENGLHDHTVTNAASGGDHNLAAGVFIRCCIAY